MLFRTPEHVRKQSRTSLLLMLVTQHQGERCESTRTFVTQNQWKVAVAVTRWGTLRVSWHAHLADPSPAEARASHPDPSAQLSVA